MPVETPDANFSASSPETAPDAGYIGQDRGGWQPVTPDPADLVNQPFGDDPEDAPANGEGDGEGGETEPAEAKEGEEKEDTRFDKHPRFQQLIEDNRRLKEQAALAQQYEADKPLYDEAKAAGFNTVGDYLGAIQQQQDQITAEREQQAAQQARIAELQENVNNGDITAEMAERLLNMEQIAARTQAQQRQTSITMNRQALKEVQSEVPALSAHKDLLGVLEATLTNGDGAADVIRTVGREVKALHAAAEQAGYDRAVREAADKSKPAPPPVNNGFGLPAAPRAGGKPTIDNQESWGSLVKGIFTGK